MSNRYNLSLIALLTSVFVFISSCDYQPTEMNYHNIDSTFKNNVFDIDCNMSLYEDTITINAQYLANFSYKYKGKPNDFIRAIITIDDSIFLTKSQYYEVTKSYAFQTKSPIEYHKATLKVFIHSGTISMADILGAEVLYLQKDWVLKVVSLKTFMLDSLRFTPIEGSLKISWKLPLEFGDLVSNFTIKKSINGYRPIEKIVGISNAIKNKVEYEIFDNSYIGEQAEYLITINFKNNADLINYPITIKTAELTQFKFEYDKTSAKLVWDRCKYYKNFEMYKISNNMNSQDINQITNINDTSLVISSVQFGGFTQYFIDIIPQNEINFNNIYRLRISNLIGEKFYLNSLIRNSKDYIYFNTNYKNTIYKYDIKNNTLIDSANGLNILNDLFKFELSPNGKYMIRLIGNGKLIFSKDDNFNGETFDLSTLFNISASSNIYMNINDNGVACFSYTNQIWVYDFINKKLIANWQKKQFQPVYISQNGNYCASTEGNDTIYIYKIDGGTANITKKVKGYINYFDNNSPANLSYLDLEFKKNVLLDCNTLSLIGNLNYLGQFKNIDFINNKVAYSLSKSITIYSSNDINSKSVYDLNFTGNFFFVDNTIYFSNGVKVRLE
jgi:hypothetical protein